MSRHKFPVLHAWKINSQQAKQIQTNLRRLVITADEIADMQTVAGVDVGFVDNNSVARAAVVILTYPDLLVLDSATAKRRVRFPYIPGYLSFREVPSILAALAKIEHLPDLILCDGQGYAHPRRFGLACHLGVITGIPTIGVAKTRLLGEHTPVGVKKGAWKPLMHQDERIGAVLRTRSNTKPVYVSVGHKVCLSTAINMTLNCCTKYRLPETTRAAHKLASTLP
ncbi:MAG: deoxyribonuclease V [Arenicellales bacterium]|nr:deoxyribonuclease V [Arenicellales bacterium]